MKVGIIPNFTRDKTYDVVLETVKNLEKFNIDYCFDLSFFGNYEKEFNSTMYTKISHSIFEESDIIIAIGGDGSFIHIAKKASEYNKPVLCINAGNLAFLAGLECNELNLLLELVKGNYLEDKRMMLDVEIIYNNKVLDKFCCLNDLTVARGKEISLIDLDVFCDNKKINSYRADGVIVSTPTGSTAYSWSAGGPVIDPNLQCITLTPICTHSPLNRSLVFNENSQITIIPSKNNDYDISISADGEKTVVVPKESQIIIKKSKNLAEFIRIKSDEFFDILNSKLTQRKF